MGNSCNTGFDAPYCDMSGQLWDTTFRRAVEASPIPVPPEDVEEEYALLLEEFRHRLAYDSLSSGRPVYQYDGVAEQMESLKGTAAFNVKARLVLQEVIRREGLTVSPAELEEEAAAAARRLDISPAQVRELLGEELSLLRADLLERKAADLLCGLESKE